MYQEWLPLLPIPLLLSTLRFLLASLSKDIPNEPKIPLLVIPWDAKSDLAFP